MTTVLCPTRMHELAVSPYQALVEDPYCGQRYAVEDLAPRDETPCSCGHRLAAHGPRHGLTYACPLSTCNCREPKPKETTVPDTKINHRREAERLLQSADEWLDADMGWKGGLSRKERIQLRHDDLLAANTHAMLADPPVSTVRIDAP